MQWKIRRNIVPFFLNTTFGQPRTTFTVITTTLSSRPSTTRVLQVSRCLQPTLSLVPPEQVRWLVMKQNVAETANSNLYKNNLGHNFWTNNNHTATIYMPALGCLHPNTFGLESFGEMGYYWTACPCDFRTGCVFFFGKRYVYPKEKLGLLAGCSVRPVTE